METGLCPSLKQDLAPQMRLALSVLSMSHGELAEYMQSQYEENPLLEIHDVRAVPMRSRPVPGGQAPLENIPGEAHFKDNLIAQLDILHMTQREAKICRMVIALLDSDGFLREDLAEYQRLGRIADDAMAKAIQEVQSLDPPGVAARDIPEFLCILLRRKGETREIMFDLARAHYDAVAKKDYTTIAKALRISRAEAETLCDELRALRPVSMGGSAARYVQPDIIVAEEDGDMTVQVYDANLRLSMRGEPIFAQDAALSKEDIAYMRERKRQAFQAMRAIEMRNMTLRQLAELLVSEQMDFFMGRGALHPLLQSTLASAMGVHASTVSRAVKGKWLLCDRGMFPLAYFFMREVDGRGRDAVKEMLRSIVRRQPTLSDREISDVLAEEGIHIARRTVAKYRAEMGLR